MAMRTAKTVLSRWLGWGGTSASVAIRCSPAGEVASIRAAALNVARRGAWCAPRRLCRSLTSMRGRLGALAPDRRRRLLRHPLDRVCLQLLHRFFDRALQLRIVTGDDFLRRV